MSTIVTLPITVDATGQAIALLGRQLQALKEHYNSFPPINVRIPPEILSNILLLLVQSHMHPFFTDSANYSHGRGFAGRRVYAWLQYTHVCRHWRSVALQCAPVWSFIFVDYACTSFEIVEAMISRSRRALLTVRVYYNSPSSHLDDWDSENDENDEEDEEPNDSLFLRYLKAVFAELHRIQELAVSPLKINHILDLGGVEALHDAPFLRVAHLIANRFRTSTERHALQFSNGHTLQRLQGITLADRYPLEEAIKWFRPTLTYLNLCVSHRLNAEILLQALNGVPLLQSLRLSNSLDEGPIQVPEHDIGFIVRLQYLDHLEVDSFCTGGGVWLQLLRHMSFPTTARIHYEEKVAVRPDISLRTISYFGDHYRDYQTSGRHIPPPKFLSCSISSQPFSFSIELWDEGPQNFINGLPGGNQVDLSPRFFLKLSMAASTSLPVQSVSNMVYSLHRMEPSRCCEALRRMGDIQFLCLSGIAYVRLSLYSSSTGSQELQLFPKLKALLVFDKARPSGQLLCMPGLQQSLLARMQKSGQPLHRLLLVLSPSLNVSIPVELTDVVKFFERIEHIEISLHYSKDLQLFRLVHSYP